MSFRLLLWFFLIVAVAAVPCIGATGSPSIDAASTLCAEPSAIPPNLTIDDDYLRLLTNGMAMRSPTFRQQLQTLAAAPLLRARFGNRMRLISPAAFAETNFGFSKSGLLVADIVIPVPLVFGRRIVEYIAHEIEHVIEQLEGIDLPALARKRGSGVYHTDVAGRAFETVRAISAGRMVDREYRESTADVGSCG